MKGTGHDTSSFPAAAGHLINFSQIRMVRNTIQGKPQSMHRFGPNDRVGTLNVDNAERAFLIRSGDKDWGVLYGVAQTRVSSTDMCLDTVGGKVRLARRNVVIWLWTHGRNFRRCSYRI